MTVKLLQGKSRLSLIVRVNVVLNSTVAVDSDWRFDSPKESPSINFTSTKRPSCMIRLVWPLFGRQENKVRDTEGDDQFWSINAAHVACLFENLIIKAMFLLKIVLIYDEPLLRSRYPEGGRFNGGSNDCRWLVMKRYIYQRATSSSYRKFSRSKSYITLVNEPVKGDDIGGDGVPNTAKKKKKEEEEEEEEE